MRRVLINSRTSGKFRLETINGRSHIVTTIMPIRGDTAMNRIFYSNSQVGESFQQLESILAPSGHPEINGSPVSAHHPGAINQNHIGAFLRNVRKKGKFVFADYVIDVEIANNSDDGKETIKRIKNKEKLGVSTGLNIDTLINKTGKDDFGKDFDREGQGFHFDHVATLLNEEAAGAHAGTELVLNEGTDDEVIICNLESDFTADLELNELSTSDFHRELRDLIKTGNASDFEWIQEVFPESKTFVFTIESRTDTTMFKQSFVIDSNENFTLLDDRVEVEIDFKPVAPEKAANSNPKTEEDDMDKEKLVLSIIGNSSNAFTGDDKDRLMAMSESELIASISSPATNDQAKEVLTKEGFDFKGHEEFVANKESFAEFLKTKSEKRDTVVQEIIKNSKFTEELLKDKSDEELAMLNEVTQPKKAAANPGQGVIHTNESESEDTSDLDTI